MLIKTIYVVTTLLMLFAHPLSAQQMSLKSGEILILKDINLPETIVVKTQSGQTRNIALKDIQSVELSPATSVKHLLNVNTTHAQASDQEIKEALQSFETLTPFQTPKQTFLTWKEAAVTGSVENMVACYSKNRQPGVRKNLKKIKRKERIAMKEAANITTFSVGDPLYQGNQAFLEVTWNKGLYSESQVLKFLLENNDWKIIE